MLLMRWFRGLMMRLVGGWDDREWFYYNRVGLDPKIPAQQRWSVRLKDEQKKPETAEEELLPPHTYSVLLADNFGLTLDDLVFTTNLLDKAQAVLHQFEKELRTRTSADFYYNNIRNRRLDFFHNFRAVGNDIVEGSAQIDEEQEREKFLR